MRRMKLKKNVYILISYILLIAIIPTTLLFSAMVGDRMNEHIEQTVENTARLCAEMIERQYQGDILMLDSLSARMSITLATDPEIGVQRMVSTAERYGMKRISFSQADGYTISTDGNIYDMAEVDYFKRAMQGESLLTNVIQDVNDKKYVNVYAMPVYDQDTFEIIGVLSAIYYSEMFEEILAVSAYDGQGYTYITDSRGNMIIASHHPNAVPNVDNIFTYMESQNQNSEVLIQVKKNMNAKESGFFTVEHEKGGRCIYYSPLKFNDWYVVSAVPTVVAEQTKSAVMMSVVVYCIGISVAAVFVVISIQHVMREKNNQLKKALYVDPVTGGRSYEKFVLDAKKRLDEKKYRHVACVFLDIDNFNLVSTLYGNEESEDTIRRVYALIQNTVGDKGIIGRNSQDQFGVMFFYMEPAELEKSIDRFIITIHENAKFETMLRPTLGVYVVDDITESVDDMMNKARTAHETIKQNSAAQIAYYDVSFRDKKFENKHMEDEMERALKKHEFVPYLQPKYSAATGEIIGAEALIRWIAADGKIIPPGKFIPLAENNGFVRNLDREMFSMTCRLQRKILDMGLNAVPISVNVSRQLLYDKNFANDYFELINGLGISADLIELEITESALFEDINLFRSTLETLRKMGFRILMDDFGTGYSSLMMLHTVPIDQMKLDKSFVDDYEDEKGSSIIRCVLDLAKMLKIPVVAEGVETESQYLYLKEAGCDFIQGYYFSKPLPEQEYIEKLK